MCEFCSFPLTFEAAFSCFKTHFGWQKTMKHLITSPCFSSLQQKLYSAVFVWRRTGKWEFLGLFSFNSPGWDGKMPEAAMSCLMHISCIWGEFQTAASLAWVYRNNIVLNSAALCKLKLLCLIIFVTSSLLDLGADFQRMECSGVFSVCKHLNLNWSNELGDYFTGNVTFTVGFFPLSKFQSGRHPEIQSILWFKTTFSALDCSQYWPSERCGALPCFVFVHGFKKRMRDYSEEQV